MPIDLAKYWKYHAILYTDAADVYRSGATANEDGTQDNRLGEIPAISGMPCRLSFDSIDAAEGAHTGEPVRFQMKLFCGAEHDIRAGDFIEVARLGHAYSGRAGEPAKYAAHQEILIKRQGVA